MKKATGLLIGFFILTGCAETMALLGPATSLVQGGNVINSSITSAIDYGVTKKTGKSSIKHVLAYAEEKNPNQKKDRCISFVKKTESEACYIVKKEMNAVKKSTTKKIKNVIASSRTNVVKKSTTKKIKNVISPSRTKEVKKIKNERNSSLQIKERKNYSNLKIKEIETLKLKSLESVFVESALSKKQLSNLRVSIEKSSKVKDLSK